MSTRRWMSLVKRLSFISGAAVFTACLAVAQSSTGSSSAFSSSLVSSSADDGGDAALPAAPSPGGGAAAGQEYGKHSGSIFSRMAFEGGGGFNAPSSDSSSFITWGGNFTVGAGLHLNPRVSVLAEYQFIDDKLPGAFIAQTGANGGNAHIWSLTLAPIVDLAPKRTNSFYVTGGGGFYRKVTNFTDPEEAEYCYYYYCGVGTTNVVVGHFSSNQGGWNVGGGFTHRMGGTYGDGKTKLFAEVRYLDVLTPASAISPNGLGVAAVGSDTKLVPVTLGIRF